MEIKEIRDLLMDYYGTAIQANPCAIFDLSQIEQITDEEVIQLALKNKLIRLSD